MYNSDHPIPTIRYKAITEFTDAVYGKQFTVIIIPDTYFIIIEELDSVVCDLCIILHDRFTIHVIDFYVPAVFFFGIAV